MKTEKNRRFNVIDFLKRPKKRANFFIIIVLCEILSSFSTFYGAKKITYFFSSSEGLFDISLILAVVATFILHYTIISILSLPLLKKTEDTSHLENSKAFLIIAGILTISLSVYLSIQGYGQAFNNYERAKILAQYDGEDGFQQRIQNELYDPIEFLSSDLSQQSRYIIKLRGELEAESNDAERRKKLEYNLRNVDEKIAKIQNILREMPEDSTYKESLNKELKNLYGERRIVSNSVVKYEKIRNKEFLVKKDINANSDEKNILSLRNYFDQFSYKNFTFSDQKVDSSKLLELTEKFNKANDLISNVNSKVHKLGPSREVFNLMKTQHELSELEKNKVEIRDPFDILRSEMGIAILLFTVLSDLVPILLSISIITGKKVVEDLENSIGWFKKLINTLITIALIPSLFKLVSGVFLGQPTVLKIQDQLNSIFSLNQDNRATRFLSYTIMMLSIFLVFVYFFVRIVKSLEFQMYPYYFHF